MVSDGDDFSCFDINTPKGNRGGVSTSAINQLSARRLDTAQPTKNMPDLAGFV